MNRGLPAADRLHAMRHRSTKPALFSVFFLMIGVLGCRDATERAATSPDTAKRLQPDTAPSADSAVTSARTTLACTLNQSANDRTICADRLGPITRTTTRADLAGLFPTPSLVDTAVHVGEGQFEPGTILVAHGDSLTIIWSDSTRSRIVGFTGLGRAWRTPDGLHVSSSLAEMERVLGPFAVLGFGWDYGGTAMLANTALEDSGIFFRMQPRHDSTRATAAYQRVRGDREYPTNSVDVRALDLIVRAIDINWR